MMKQYMILRFKRDKNEVKMVFIFNQIKIEVISGFKVQLSKEWSYMWFSCSNVSRMKLK